MKRLFSKKMWNENKKRFEPGWMQFDQRKITALEFGQPEGKKARQKFVDVADLCVGPSAVDLHVHVRDFDESHKETFESCEYAALKGGVKAVVAMANSWPRIDSVDRVSAFLKKASKYRVRFLPLAAVTKNLEGKEPTDWSTILKMPVAGLSDDGRPIMDEKIFESALLACKRAHKILSLHEEDIHTSCKSLVHECEVPYRLGLDASPAKSEYSMVARDLAIAEKISAPVHFGHISSKEAVAAIRKARKRGVRVSAELTPHHGLLTVDDLENIPPLQQPLFKVCPPIRQKEDQNVLRAGLRDGTIDCFASDHAPHSELEKELPYADAAHGIIALEYFYPLYLQLRAEAEISWDRFFSCLAVRPAELLNQRRHWGSLALGSEASFVVFDPEQKQNLRWSRSKSSNTPLRNKNINGQVIQHWICGEKVYDGVKERK